jgi:hypothetical protein
VGSLQRDSEFASRDNMNRIGIIGPVKSGQDSRVPSRGSGSEPTSQIVAVFTDDPPLEFANLWRKRWIHHDPEIWLVLASLSAPDFGRVAATNVTSVALYSGRQLQSALES